MKSSFIWYDISMTETKARFIFLLFIWSLFSGAFLMLFYISMLWEKSPYLWEYVECNSNWFPWSIKTWLVQYHDKDYLVVEGIWSIWDYVCGIDECIEPEKRYDVLWTRTSFCRLHNPSYEDLVREAETIRENSFIWWVQND